MLDSSRRSRSKPIFKLSLVARQVAAVEGTLLAGFVLSLSKILIDSLLGARPCRTIVSGRAIVGVGE
jgi:hypothetical protein